MHFENENMDKWSGDMRESVAASPRPAPSILTEELQRLNTMVNDLEQIIWDRAQNKLAFVLGPDLRTQQASPDMSELKAVHNDSAAVELVIGIQKNLDHFIREMTAVLDRVQL